MPTAAASVAIALCAQPAPPADAQPDGAFEAFPHVRVDREARTVEFDGRVPILVDDPEAPKLYLELIACTPNTKEHESLVVTPARPSHIHAALLMIGLEPGAPARWVQEDRRLRAIPPSGDPLTVEFLVPDGSGGERRFTPSQWVINADTRAPWPLGSFVFSGSLMLERGGTEHYEADNAGTLLGLTSFGTETIAWPNPISPESDIDEPEWIANPRTVPGVDTPVTVVLRAVGE